VVNRYRIKYGDGLSINSSHKEYERPKDYEKPVELDNQLGLNLKGGFAKGLPKVED